MTFLELALLFSTYTVGFLHLIFGFVGMLTGSSIVFPMPYGLRRPFLYVWVAGLLVHQGVRTYAGIWYSEALCLLLLLYLVYETICPFLVAKTHVVGTTEEAIRDDLQRALTHLEIPYKSAFPHYTLVAPFAKLHVAFRPKLGVAEIRIRPFHRSRLLRQIADALAKEENKHEDVAVSRVYIGDILIGIGLIALSLWKVASLVS